MSRKQRGALCWAVFAVWAVNLLAPLVVSSYSPNVAANAPLMLVLGVALRPPRGPK